MIQVTCENCLFRGNYHTKSLKEIQNNPPFCNMPLLDGEDDHKWIIKEVPSE